ncbi:MAG: PH domain-containing protein [Nocardioidaceae bacterium]|nr:PH domain-containing protein [Nocardioidaceae bacterium]MCL2614891.1 PH domain-containing protein [Nocardioidaceae bacterium]
MAISKKLLNPGEHLILSCRQHVKALFGPIFLLVVLLAIGVAVQIETSWQTLHLIVWALVVIGAIWMFVAPLLDWLATVYGFTDRRIITRKGIITRRGHDIPLSRVSDIESEINLMDRPFGCGSLLVSDASTNGTTRLNDIPNIEAVQRQLNELLYDLHEGGRDGDA